MLAMKKISFKRKNANAVDEAITELKQYLLMTIPAELKESNISGAEYLGKYRRDINNKIFGICFGAAFVPSKDNNKLKMNLKYPLPTMTQVAQLAELIDSYIQTVEVGTFGETFGVVDDDKTIPSRSTNGLHLVPDMDSVSKKKICADIVGWNGDGLQTDVIDGTDVMYLAGLGEQLRKKENRKRTLIVLGGVVVGVAAAGTVVFLMNEKKKKGHTCDGDNADIDVDDIDVIDDVPSVDIDSSISDVPVVDID